LNRAIGDFFRFFKRLREMAGIVRVRVKMSKRAWMGDESRACPARFAEEFGSHCPNHGTDAGWLA
jgi:hypothetical protein